MKYQATLTRFIKGFISGAITAMLGIAVFVPKDFTELKTILIGLALAGMAGGINGLLLAIQKWVSWDDAEYVR